MKKFASKTASFLCIGLVLTACSSSNPSADEVLNSYRNWASIQEKLGHPIRPLPPEAMVDHCDKDKNPPNDKYQFANCYIRFGGKTDTNLNPYKMYRKPDGHWDGW